jgi:protein-S-isoprenylcysteine O-methyltransferase Ste14
MLVSALFRLRGPLGFVAFAAGLALAVPSARSCLAGLWFVLPGLALRFWAMGFIGPGARSSEIGGKERVVSGPYRLLAHPLYTGNLLLVCGMLLALRPVPWFVPAVLGGFLVEYGLFAAAEQRHLSAGLPAASPGFGLRGALAEWRTWLYVGMGWLLALAKALLVTRQN